MNPSNKVLFIINGMIKTGGVVSVSGGDVRLMEVARNLEGTQKELLTTKSGEEYLAKYPEIGIKKTYILKHNLSAGAASGLGLIFKSWFFRKSGVKEFKNGLVYSSCEHLYDVLPALRLKLFNHCQWYAVYHWVEDYPWREKRGNTPVVQRYAYWLQRHVAGILIKHFSNKILAVSDPTKEKLITMKHIKPSKIKAVYCGVNYAQIRQIVDKYKSERGSRYDAVFMKRLNYGKGVLDLLKIWREVVKVKADARLAIIGDGSAEVVGQIKEYLAANGLEGNVELLGVIYDMEEKFRVINSAKIFLLPTHEENWAIVIGEAMAAGVPVVVSKLEEITPIWKDNVVWCTVGDIKQFATEVLGLISEEERASRLANKALRFIPRYDWRSIGKEELD